MENYNALFDKWSLTYDETVFGDNNEYTEVFENYKGILETISNLLGHKKNAKVLEVGVGTGNLLEILHKDGYMVKGIEPSHGMRKIAQHKLPQVEIADGHFMSVPFKQSFDGIVTSYALHHLSLKEKKEALIYLNGFLKDDGKIVIADTMFESKEYKEKLYKYVEENGQLNLLQDLNTEHYEYIEDMTNLFKELGYQYELTKMNRYVWILSAKKGGK